MGWPTALPKLFTFEPVTVRRAGPWTQDSSGGKVRTLGPPSEPTDAVILPGGTARNINRPSNFRDAMTARYTVIFVQLNPKLHMHDEIYWISEDVRMVVMVAEVTGTSDVRLYEYYCEQHPEL